ncbi:helix-turn-helix transcriptional regulator [Pantoea sp. At-9b]|uniref:helix-turn-helix transcriptional regulator n=1 Tax=Pantoea sp. (strain At-9b) TaxID=592316 RepID=UPI0001B3DE22|nr:AraC family transcriptional regulator [Pantoea sp. At-9b]ADU71846.1 transcriptional regulator, AraC family [Pantoea sp. At-9b]
MNQSHKDALLQPGISHFLAGNLRLTRVYTTLQQDLRLSGTSAAHLSLVIMREGSGHFSLQPGQLQAFQPGSLLLSSSRFPCAGEDFFPRHYLYDLFIVNYPVGLCDALDCAGLDSGGSQGQVWRAPLNATLEALQQQIDVACRDQSAFGQLQLESLLLSLLWHGIAQVQQGEDCRAGGALLMGRDRQRLIRARDYMQQHACRELTLEEVARAAGMSQLAFKRGFRAMFTITPWNFVIECRLQQAQLLLRQTMLTLDDIATRCGFSHASHLSRYFQRQYGQSPGRYRRQITAS